MKIKYFIKTMLITICLTLCLPFVNVSAWHYFDVPDDHWACEAISTATKERWFAGYSDGTFRPGDKITRAEATKVLVSFLNIEALKKESCFRDVDDSAWYANYVMAGKDLFIKRGAEEYFYPDEPVSREDVIYALMRGLDVGIKLPWVDISLVDNVADSEKISAEARPYFAMALQTNFVSGYTDGTVRPKNELTRAEFAVLLARAEENLR